VKLTPRGAQPLLDLIRMGKLAVIEVNSDHLPALIGFHICFGNDPKK
jgi:hypothetical protein